MPRGVLQAAVLALCVVIGLLAASPALGQENDECLMCHGEADLTGERAGREISVHVDVETFARSVHAELECVVCHQDLAGAELPHAEETEAVDCSLCHDEPAASHTRSLHGRAAARGDEMAPTCAECHGTHDILSHLDPRAPTATVNVPQLCGNCHREGSPVSRTHKIHRDNILAEYTESIHGEGLNRQGLRVTAVCTSCHTSHDILPHTDPASSIHPDNLTRTCTQCHARIEQVHRKVIEGRLWEEAPGKIPVCVDCHSPHRIRRVFYPAGMANKDCLKCHGRPGLTMQRDGRAVSIHVDEEEFELAAHAEVACAQCHSEVSASEERSCATIVSGVNCGVCHEGQADSHARSLHGRAAARGDEMAPTCAECHGTHDILSHLDPRAPTATVNVPLLCGQCHQEGSPVSRTHEIHQDNILANYSQSIHGEGLFKQGLTVTAVCTSCHTSHDILPHTDPASSIHPKNLTRTCTKCHARIEQVHRKFIEGRLWEEQPGKIPVCVDCHSPHEIRRVFYPAGMANKDCLNCHGQPDLAVERNGETVSLYVDEGDYGLSAHREKACAQCHTDVSPSEERSCATVASKVDCSICHAEQVQQYEISTHGTLHAQGDPDAPSCQDCHAKHTTTDKSTPTSTTFPRNVPVLCARCHRAGEQAAVRIHSDMPIVESYLDSIHGTGMLQSGLVVTAFCTSCHTTHGELPPEDPRSSVNSANIADTCGRCHHGIEEVYKASIHFTGEPKDGRELPTCEDCHSSHTITRHDKPGFRTNMMNQCGRCHESEASTFFDTFHGKVSRLGAEGPAKCYDCHGTHDILPVANPASRLSRERVVDTCGNCHEGSHRRFAGYLTHATHHDPDKYPWLFWSFWFMTALLVGTLTFALLHTLAWLTRLFLTREEWKAHKLLARANGNGRVYRRFNRLQRTMHLLMILSFFTLALTGMSLKFSYSGWAQVISRMLGGIETMGVLHRMGGIMLFAIFAVHLWDVFRRKRSTRQSWRQLVTGPDSIVFNLSDVKQVGQSIRWFFGIGPRPSYGRYTYWEKFDYFAVFWGVMVIGSTGLVLWFPELFTYLMPGWSINVATIIHSDEALLAVGFIFTIHFFNTHFRPDKFPMDPVIFTGRITVDELKYDKPAEYESLVANGGLEQHLVEPFPQQVERGFKVFGFIALAVGLSLIGLIVYAMLFGYR